MNCLVVLMLAFCVGCTHLETENTIIIMEQVSPLKHEPNWRIYLSTPHECILIIYSSPSVQFLINSTLIRELLISITGMWVANTLKHRVFYFQKLSNQIMALLAILLVNLNYLSHLITYCVLHPGFRLLLVVLAPYAVTIMRVAMVPGIGNLAALKLSCYMCLLYAFPRTENRTFKDMHEWLEVRLDTYEEALNRKLEIIYIKNGIIEVSETNSFPISTAAAATLPCYGSC